MRNQNFETDFAWNFTECNALCQFKVITDLTQCLHYHHGVLIVVHKEAVRAHKISWCLYHIYPMYNPIWTSVSNEGIKITITRKHLSISFGARRKQFITEKIAFNYFYKLNSEANKLLSNASGRGLSTFLRFSSAKPEIQLNRGYALNWLAGVLEEELELLCDY